MESHIVARIAQEYNCPFIILRVISDQADHALPPAFSVAMQPDGSVAIPALLKSLLLKTEPNTGFRHDSKGRNESLERVRPRRFPFWQQPRLPGFRLNAAERDRRTRPWRDADWQG